MPTPMYGRIQVAEPLSNLACLHVHDGATPLKIVDHEPKIGVLDQSDLIEQGIYTDLLVPGAPRIDAIGACTDFTLVEATSNILSPTEFGALVGRLVSRYPDPPADVYADVVEAAKAAIVLYHLQTVLTGDPGVEWPPNDCGSSGPFIASEAIRQGICSSQLIAHSMQDVCSLMQRDGVLIGIPFFNVWEEPDAHGFIDGNGRVSDLQAAIASGIAGGHELYLSAIEKIAFLATGALDLMNTVFRFRNHWTRGWGDNGSGRVHGSTLSWIASHADYRQIRR